MGEHGISDKLGRPVIEAGAWVAPGAVLVGKILVRKGASIWYNCVLRSDMDGAEIEIGEDANIQDGTVVHVDANVPCRVGARVTVGHGAILHACTIEDDCIIGMGAIVLDGAVIKRGTIVGAGALVPPRKSFPEGSLLLGTPAGVARKLTEGEVRHNADHARQYRSFWEAYKKRGIGAAKR